MTRSFFSLMAVAPLLIAASVMATDLETAKQKRDSGDLEGARAAFQALIDADGGRRQGLIQQHRGRTEAARAQFEAALELDPDHDEAKKALRGLR